MVNSIPRAAGHCTKASEKQRKSSQTNGMTGPGGRSREPAGRSYLNRTEAVNERVRAIRCSFSLGAPPASEF